MPTRGRVIACGDQQAVVRTEQFDLTITNPPRSWRPGQLVEVETTNVVRDYADDYPQPGSEVMRMPRRRLELLRERARALATVRAFFADRGFLEVETPLLVPSPGLEIHLDAVRAGDGWLITSPEYQMKRLLAAGCEAIYQVCKCFRAGEHGAHHASEFTMIEWYRAYATLDDIVADTELLVHAVCGDRARVAAREGQVREDQARDSSAREGQVREDQARDSSAREDNARDKLGPPVREIDVRPPWPRMTVRDAMARWAGVQIDGAESAGALVRAVRAAGIEVAEDSAWDDAFFAAFLARVEPAIAALDHALILEDWPAPLAALARRKDERTALRFEAYVGGIELANAFDELTDADEQRSRFVHDQEVRAARHKPVYPLDEKLLNALREGLPPCAGIALGFDRLVMLATGADAISQVLSFSADEL